MTGRILAVLYISSGGCGGTEWSLTYALGKEHRTIAQWRTRDQLALTAWLLRFRLVPL